MRCSIKYPFPTSCGFSSHVNTKVGEGGTGRSGLESLWICRSAASFMDWEEQSLLASFLGRIVVRRARKSALPITGKLLKF